MNLQLEVPYGMHGEWWGTTRENFYVGPKNKRSKKITHILDRREIDHVYGNLDDFIERLKAVAASFPEGTENIGINLRLEEKYGDTEAFLTVEGWRPMTPHELDCLKEQQEADERYRAQREKSEFERIKREHPEWINDAHS